MGGGIQWTAKTRLTAPTDQSFRQSIHIFVPCHWLNISRPWPVSKNNAQRDSRSVDVYKTCLNHINRFAFRVSSKNRKKETEYFTSDIRVTQNNPPNILYQCYRRQRFSNTKSPHTFAFNNHVSQLHTKTDLTSTLYTWSSVNNQRSWRRHRCLNVCVQTFHHPACDRVLRCSCQNN